jgi:hypothetical protein
MSEREEQREEPPKRSLSLKAELQLSRQSEGAEASQGACREAPASTEGGLGRCAEPAPSQRPSLHQPPKPRRRDRIITLKFEEVILRTKAPRTVLKSRGLYC